MKGVRKGTTGHLNWAARLVRVLPATDRELRHARWRMEDCGVIARLVCGICVTGYFFYSHREQTSG